MNAFEADSSEQAPLQIIQPCSEACACFQRLAGNGWSDFGVCTNPESPFRGFPVQIGRDCRNYQSSGEKKTA